MVEFDVVKDSSGNITGMEPRLSVTGEHDLGRHELTHIYEHAEHGVPLDEMGACQA